MITFIPPATAVTAEDFGRNGNSFAPDLHIIVMPEDVAAAEWTQHILDKYADKAIAYSVGPVFGNDTFVIELQFADTPAGRATAKECVKEYKSGFRKGGDVARRKKEANARKDAGRRPRLLKHRMYLLPDGQYFWYFARCDHHGNVAGKVESVDRPRDSDGSVWLENRIVHRSVLEQSQLIPKGQEPWVS